MTEMFRHIGPVVRALRIKKGIRLRAMARALAKKQIPGSQPKHLSLRERGELPWSMEQLEAAAFELGTTVGAIVSLAETGLFTAASVNEPPDHPEDFGVEDGDIPLEAVQ